MAPDEAAAAKIELMSESGTGHVVPRSAVKTIDERLNNESPEVILADLESGLYGEPVEAETSDPSVQIPSTGGDGTSTTAPPASTGPTNSGGSSDDGGCAGGAGGGLPWVMALALWSCALLRRRL